MSVTPARLIDYLGIGITPSMLIVHSALTHWFCLPMIAVPRFISLCVRHSQQEYILRPGRRNRLHW